MVNSAHTYRMDEGFFRKSNAKLGLLPVTVTHAKIVSLLSGDILLEIRKSS